MFFCRHGNKREKKEKPRFFSVSFDVEMHFRLLAYVPLDGARRLIVNDKGRSDILKVKFNGEVRGKRT